MSEVDNSITQELAAQGIQDTKPCGVVVMVAEYTNGVIDQKIVVNEKSENSEENVYKYQWISDAVVEALNGKNEAGSGGVFREMGEGFLAVMDEAGGDWEVAKEIYKEARKAGGQGKPRKNK